MSPRISASVVVALAVLLVVAGPTRAQVPFQLDGSSAFNPAPFVQAAIALVRQSIEAAVSMTCRAIGTQDVANEWWKTAVDFALSDVPLKPSWGGNGTTVNIPLMAAAVSFFHSIPFIGQGLLRGLNLSPNTLADIYMGSITTWSDHRILDDNINNPVAMDFLSSTQALNQPINVVKMTSGSSSTWGVVQYFEGAAVGQWYDPDSNGWDTQNWVGVNASTAQDMIDYMAANPYSICYAVSNPGIAAGLKEINIRNSDQTVWINSGYSGVSGVVSSVINEPLLEATFPPDQNITADWSLTNFIDVGNAFQWPITIISYWLLRQDSTVLGDAGALLLQVVNQTLSDDMAATILSAGFVPMPSAIRANLQHQLATGVVITNGVPLVYNTAPAVDNAAAVVDNAAPVADIAAPVVDTTAPAVPQPQLAQPAVDNTAQVALQVGTAGLVISCVEFVAFVVGALLVWREFTRIPASLGRSPDGPRASFVQQSK